MSLLEKLSAIALVAGYIGLGWAIWKVGLVRFYQFLVTMFKNLMGVTSKIPDEAPPPGCMILHKNAQMEIEYYGKIMSWSVEQHVLRCPFSLDLAPKPLPPLTENKLKEVS